VSDTWKGQLEAMGRQKRAQLILWKRASKQPVHVLNTRPAHKWQVTSRLAPSVQRDPEEHGATGGRSPAPHPTQKP
jgi:hypothetical protein